MESLRELLDKSSCEERAHLAKILGTDSSTPRELINQLRWNYQPWWNSLLGCEPGYREIVEYVAQSWKIPDIQSYSTIELEIKIAQKVLEFIWEKMTPEQRQQIEAELLKNAQEFDKTGAFVGSGSIFAALLSARLSGFGVYLLASTSLGFLTSMLGITLPFAAYTTVSSAIATIIGPVGWIGAALFAIWQSGSPNLPRLTSAVVYICLLRSKYFLTSQSNGVEPDWSELPGV